jgi:putative ABC transport system permease protein
MRVTEYLDSLEQDFRYAARGLIRRPGFTAVAVLTLAIGIGGTTAIFSAVNALLLRRLPYAAPEQLMTVSVTTPAHGGLRARDDMVWSYPKYTVFRDAQSVFSDISLYSTPQRFTITTGQVELIHAEFVGAHYLRTLGLAPVRGRDFDPSIDAHAGAERQVIMSYSLWQRRYNADASIVGKTVDLSDLGESWRTVTSSRNPYTVVGVAPDGFRGLTGQADAFIPITTRPAKDLVEQSQSHEFFMVARRKPDIGVAAATGAVTLLGVRVREAFNEDDVNRGWGATARPLDDIRVSPIIRRALLVAFGAVGCVLLIACVNVANLLLGRASMRRREIAVRLALGGTRRRVVRQLLTESMLLAALGGLAGVGLAWAGARALSTVDPDTMVPRGNDTLNGLGAVTFSGVHVDWTALAFSLSITLFVGLVFGLVPALEATRASLSDEMKATAGDSDVRQRGAGGRRMLVVVEVALAMILLAGSGLLIRSFGKLMAIDPGFRAEHVLTLRLTIPPDVAERSMPGFYTELLDRLRALPGIVDASLNSCPPLGGGCFRTPIEFPDRAKVDGAPMQGVRVSWATPTWFATVHVPLKRGRLFAGSDRSGAPKVVVINEAAARTFWGDDNPLGKRVTVNGDTGEVIGIVGDVRQFVDSLAKPEVYLPYAQSPTSQMMIFVRVAGDPVALAASARRAIYELAPQYPVYDIQPMTARAAGAAAQAEFSAVLLGLFAATALTLAGIGIYGVMALVVTARTREIGIRMALGADRYTVRRLVVSEGVSLVSVGVILGLAGALACTRVLQKLLFDLAPTDPVTYCAIVALLGLATVAASWIPARRASSVDPVVALRAE